MLAGLTAVRGTEPYCAERDLPTSLCPCPAHRSEHVLPNGEALGHPFQAKYAGSCISCNYPFSAGSLIVAVDGGGYAHATIERCLIGEPFESKYRGRCIRCGERYEAGMLIAHVADPVQLAQRSGRRHGGYIHAGVDRACRGG